MIRFSNGHSFKYMVASGALGFDSKGWPWEKPLITIGLMKPELFTIVLKTLTLHPRKGNLRWWKPWECVRLIPGGAVNKVGLTNPGIVYWLSEIMPTIDFENRAIVVSIYGTEEELVTMAALLNRDHLPKPAAIEINVSCPNTGHRMDEAKTIIRSVRAVRRVSDYPIIVKVSVDQDYLTVSRELEEEAEAISLNSVPWRIAFPSSQSPLSNLERKVGGGGGGVSGRPAQAFNWRAVEKLAIHGSLPVIAPSVMSSEDVIEVRALGAKAVSFGAIHLRTPWRPTSIVEKLERT